MCKSIGLLFLMVISLLSIPLPDNELEDGETYQSEVTIGSEDGVVFELSSYRASFDIIFEKTSSLDDDTIRVKVDLRGVDTKNCGSSCTKNINLREECELEKGEEEITCSVKEDHLYWQGTVTAHRDGPCPSCDKVLSFNLKYVRHEGEGYLLYLGKKFLSFLYFALGILGLPICICYAVQSIVSTCYPCIYLFASKEKKKEMERRKERGESNNNDDEDDVDRYYNKEKEKEGEGHRLGTREEDDKKKKEEEEQKERRERNIRNFLQRAAERGGSSSDDASEEKDDTSEEEKKEKKKKKHEKKKKVEKRVEKVEVKKKKKKKREKKKEEKRKDDNVDKFIKYLAYNRNYGWKDCIITFFIFNISCCVIEVSFCSFTSVFGLCICVAIPMFFFLTCTYWCAFCCS